MNDKPITAKELEELFGKVDLEQLIIDEILKEGAEEIQRQYDMHLLTTLYGSFAENRIKFEMSKATEKTLFGRKYATKKIKRNLFYDVSFYYDGILQSHYFESAKKMRKFVNGIHELVDCDFPGIRIEKTWCYRDHSARHKWYYVSYRPDSFICVEKW